MTKRVVFYSFIIPALSKSGAQVRVYSNLRAYIDLDYEIEFVFFSKYELNENIFIDGRVIEIQNVIIKESDSFKLDLNSIFSNSFRYNILNLTFPLRQLVEKTLKLKLRKYSGAIHHFEYLNTASACFGNFGSFIWSNHDYISERFIEIQKQKRKRGKGKGFIKMWFRYYCLRYAEILVAKSCNLVLTISESDKVSYEDLCPKANFEFLPMSWPGEFSLTKKRDWLKYNKLRMIHLGSLDSIVPFSSLSFILEEVFPLIRPKILNQSDFYIVGSNTDGNLSRKIKKLSSNYKNVKLTGFIENLDYLFINSDVQLVGLQFSTGLRTRIVESFFRGLPVLTTVQGSDGLCGIKDNENLMIANNASDFAKKITSLIENKSNKRKLETLSKGGSELYSKHFSRKIQSKTLKKLLKKYI